jgi:hypothetical protein
MSHLFATVRKCSLESRRCNRGFFSLASPYWLNPVVLLVSIKKERDSTILLYRIL